MALVRRRPIGLLGAGFFLILAPTSSVIPIVTEVASFDRFYLAEDYHQKYYLRGIKAVAREYLAIYPDLAAFVNSTAVARANEFHLGPDYYPYCSEYIRNAGHHKPSMLQDIEAGRRTEVDYINGKIIEYGAQAGLPARMCDGRGQQRPGVGVVVAHRQGEAEGGVHGIGAQIVARRLCHPQWWPRALAGSQLPARGEHGELGRGTGAARGAVEHAAGNRGAGLGQSVEVDRRRFRAPRGLPGPLQRVTRGGRGRHPAQRRYLLFGRMDPHEEIRVRQNFRGADCGGRIGEVKEVYVSVGGPSEECYLPPMPVPEGLDWDFWLGPAPVRPYHEDIAPPMEFDGWPNWRACSAPRLEMRAGGRAIGSKPRMWNGRRMKFATNTAAFWIGKICDT